MSSAPLMDRHLLMSMMPLGTEFCGESGGGGERWEEGAGKKGKEIGSWLLTGPTTSFLNQKILPSLRMNHLLLQDFKSSPAKENR